jgi:hypothetical protein
VRMRIRSWTRRSPAWVWGQTMPYAPCLCIRQLVVPFVCPLAWPSTPTCH